MDFFFFWKVTFFFLFARQKKGVEAAAPGNKADIYCSRQKRLVCVQGSVTKATRDLQCEW